MSRIVNEQTEEEQLFIDITKQEEITLESVSVFPNPFTTQVTIDYTEYIEQVKTIALYTIQGQHIRNIEVSQDGQTIIDTADLQSGLYLININNQKHFKVVKM